MAGLREAVLLMTHFVDDAIVALYRRLAGEAGARDVFVLLNQTDNVNPSYRIPADVKVFGFTVADLRRLGYPFKGRRLRDKDIELFPFTFWKRHPDYDRIWVVEYDVMFTGRWGDLFDAFATDDAGLLATSIHRHRVNPTWPNWPSVRTPEGPPDPARLVRAFMPLYRLTREAYVVLDAAYKRGWEGFYEGIVPGILMEAGLTVEDIGGDGEFVRPANRNRFYTSTPSSNELSPGTFVFRPVRTTPGTEPGRLWHPIKPDSNRVGWPIRRRQQIVHRARVLARSGMARLAQLWER
ncbi:MAG: hypothetical protein ACM33T_05485 [Solirubrobacterales bacterium]